MENKTYSIDTNILVRLFAKNDEKQYKMVLELLKKIKKDGSKIVIHHGVIAEVIYVMKSVYNVERKTTIESIIYVLENSPIINNDKSSLISACIYSKDHNIGFIDAYLIADAIDSGYKIKTFDKKMNYIYKKLTSL